MICKTPQELKSEVASGRSIVSIRASLVLTIVGDKELGDDSTDQAIRNTLKNFGGTNHALRVGRNVATRLAELAGQSPTPAPVNLVANETAEDETDVEEDDDI